MTLPGLTGILIRCGGIVLLFSRDLGPHRLSGNIWAQLEVIGACLSYAVSGVYTKRKLGDQHPIATSAISLSMTMLLMWVLTPVVEGSLIWPRRPLTWAAAAWLGLIGTASGLPSVILPDPYMGTNTHRVGQLRDTHCCRDAGSNSTRRDVGLQAGARRSTGCSRSQYGQPEATTRA